jgi:hypothetical protein
MYQALAAIVFDDLQGTVPVPSQPNSGLGRYRNMPWPAQPLNL